MTRRPRLPHRRLSGRLALGAALAWMTAASGSDWPQFRGPHFNSATEEPGPPTRFDPATAIAWHADLPGRGLSSPIVVGDRVFVSCGSGPRQSHLRVLCFRASDGAPLWERQFRATGRTMCHEKTSVAAPSPACDGSRLFVLYSSNDLVALDLDGNLLWLRGLTLDYPNVSNSLGMASSLATAADTVLVQVENDSQSLALGLDAATGTNRWRLERPARANWTSPVVLANGPNPAVAALQSFKGLTAVEVLTGRELWAFTNGASTVASCAVGAGVVFVPSRGMTALSLNADHTAFTPLWQAAPLRPGYASPCLLDGRLFILNDAGVLTAADVSDGRRLWQLRLKGPFSATPVGVGHHLYCVSEPGLLQVVNTRAPEGAVVAELDLAQTLLSTPAISRSALYLRSDHRLWRIGTP